MKSTPSPNGAGKNKSAPPQHNFMKFFFPTKLLALFFLALSVPSAVPDVCGQNPSPSYPWTPTQLPRTKLQINGHDLMVEVAATSESMSRGLMFRTSLPADSGMLFIFPFEHRASFWMKNTSLPLSIAYLDQDGKILEIYPLIPFEEKSVKSQSEKIRYALEVNRDWFTTHQIKPDTQVFGLPKTTGPHTKPN
jgi:uncharacterized membrane protein (UPF0127 family)